MNWGHSFIRDDLGFFFSLVHLCTFTLHLKVVDDTFSDIFLGQISTLKRLHNELVLDVFKDLNVDLGDSGGTIHPELLNSFSILEVIFPDPGSLKEKV